jgi:hypothetical protein
MARLAEAYICNLHEHWFTIRRIDGQYYNLNSLQDNPTHVGDLYLEYVSSNKLDAPVSNTKVHGICVGWHSVLLHSLVQSGHSIFVIEGTLPPPNRSLVDPSMPIV